MCETETIQTKFSQKSLTVTVKILFYLFLSVFYLYNKPFYFNTIKITSEHIFKHCKSKHIFVCNHNIIFQSEHILIFVRPTKT